MRKLLASTAVILGLAGYTGQAQAAAIDVVVVVDESGSMSGEHGWIDDMITALDAALGSLSITGNYALVGFGNGQGGGNNSGRTLTDFTTAAGFATATTNLVLTGGTEDGYAGIDYAFNNLTFGGGGATASNVILVTDEDRDNTNGALTFASILAQLTSNNALLNAVVLNSFTSDNNNASQVIGVDSDGNAYVADGSGGFTTDTNGVAGSGSGTTTADYVNLAFANSGAAWNLDLLRVGGLTAESFTAAFVDIKVQEIQQQLPEATTLGLFGLGLVGLGLASRRRKGA